MGCQLEFTQLQKIVIVAVKQEGQKEGKWKQGEMLWQKAAKE
jgi:hypothetical protein